MKNELNYDMDMCDNAQCPNAGSCMRQLAYQKAVSENYPHPLWVILNLSRDVRFMNQLKP